MHFTPKTDREMAMLVGYLGGASLEAIGQEFGVSRERVRQLLTKAGCDRVALMELGIVEIGRRGGAGVHNRLRKTLRFQGAMRARKKAKRREHIALLRQLADQLDRSPNMQDMGRALGYNGKAQSRILPYWTGRPVGRGETNWTNATTRLFRLARLPRPTPGCGNRA